MKAAFLGLAALCAQAGLAVPHRNHRYLHDKRLLQVDVVTDTEIVTDVITVTAPDVVIWVDDQGNPVSTEYRNLTPQTTSAPSSAEPTAVANAVSPSTVLAPVPSPTVSITSPSVAVSTPTLAAETTSIPSPTPTPAPSPSTTEISASASASGSSSAYGAPSAATTASNDLARIGSHPTDPDQSAGASGFSICYDLIDSSGKCKSAETMNTEFGFLKNQGYSMVRFYDIGCNVGTAVSQAAANNLKVFAGLNGIANVERDVNTLVSMLNGNWASVDTINIGNEVVNNGLASASDVVAAMSLARPLLVTAGFHGSIVTVDIFAQHVAHPALCAASDYCAANAHAFFNSQTSASGAGDFVMSAYQEVVNVAGGKRVVITESGWPYAGSSNGAAVPSADNQRTAINDIKTAFSAMPASLFLFQAYNAGYKQGGSLGVEPFFGIYGH